MLYRLDTPSGPVCDLLGPVLCRQWRSARSLAGEVCRERDEPVTITRIDNAGRLSHALTIDRTR